MAKTKYNPKEKAVTKYSHEINVETKVGILRTIAKQIYSNPAIKIREAVANSMDNEASRFIMYAHRPTRSICLFDNGTGISKEKVIEIFKNIGYGIQKPNKFSNSYFGLGLMSILELGKSAIILSKVSGENKILKLDIETEKIYSEEMEDKPISSINDFFEINNISLSDREIYSFIDSDQILNKFNNVFPQSFTEIILQNIDDSIFRTIISDEFRTTLSQILPLPIDNSDPFFNYIKDDGIFKKWIMDLFNQENRNFCPIIDFYIGIHDEKGLSQIKKYFPRFQENLEISKADIIYGIQNYTVEVEKPSGTVFEKYSYTYYYICSTEDIEKRKFGNDSNDYVISGNDDSKETGFWVRNRNFLVKRNDYFKQPGSTKKIIDQPLQKWLFGEIFHTNMTDFLIVTRDEYAWETKGFAEFYNSLYKLLFEINKKLRSAWKTSRVVTDNFITPFTNIGSNNDPFQRTQNLLENAGIIRQGTKLSEDIATVFQKLDSIRKTDIEDGSKTISNLLLQSKGKILLLDDKEVKVYIDSSVSKDKLFIKQREESSNTITVRISPEIFCDKEVTFLGKKFTVYFVAGIDNDNGISINTDEKKIFINPFNHELLKYSITMVDVYIAIEIAYSLSKSLAEMKDIFLSIVGTKLNKGSNAKKENIFTALQDELSRRV